VGTAWARGGVLRPTTVRRGSDRRAVRRAEAAEALEAEAAVAEAEAAAAVIAEAEAVIARALFREAVSDRPVERRNPCRRMAYVRQGRGCTFILEG
jgi:hypothetical protein